MSHYEHESFSDGDWDDRGDLIWNEFDWEQYLQQQDRFLHHYLELYNQHRKREDRLDYIASLMNWDMEDWAPGDPSAVLENQAPSIIFEEEASEDDEMDPYTIHRHPVYIAVKAILLSLEVALTKLTAKAASDSKIIPHLCPFLSALRECENNTLLAVQAIDFGDYALGTAQLKRSLRALNQAMAQLESLNAADSKTLKPFAQEVQIRLFDVREIWLRMMAFCREEINRQGDEGA
ncbi:MAG: hypothetical protein JJT75_06250 [Opitutales bacterium]|nr:hypothetical protein [Opitutales bacterium]MCH8539580.1 hypothetical protein [Opitutales bacterium]